MASAAAGAAPDMPADLPAGTAYHKIAPDGWCLYTAYLHAFDGFNALPVETKRAYAFALASKMAEILRGQLVDPEKRAAYTTALKEAGQTVILRLGSGEERPLPTIKGIPTQSPAGDSSLFVRVGETERAFVQDISSYVCEMTKPDPIHSGPNVWGDIEILRSVFVLLNKTVYFTVYQFLTGAWGKREELSHERGASDPEGPTLHFLHTGNHYNVAVTGPLIPAGKLAENFGDVADVTRRFTEGFMNVAHDPIVCVVGPAPAAAPVSTPTSAPIPAPEEDHTALLAEVAQHLQRAAEGTQELLTPATPVVRGKGLIPSSVTPTKPATASGPSLYARVFGAKKAAAAAPTLSPAQVAAEAARRASSTAKAPITRTQVALPAGIAPKVGPLLRVPVRRPTVSTAVPKESAAAEPTPVAGDIVMVFVGWRKYLLIHRRSAATTDLSGQLGVPAGSVEATDKTFAAAAVRELAEESGIATDAAHLTQFYTTKSGDNTVVAFLLQEGDEAKPNVPGPKAEGSDEVAEDPAIPADISGETAGGRHYWAQPEQLLARLQAPEHANPLFQEVLTKFIAVMRAGSVALASESWYKPFFDPATNIPAGCETSDFTTHDCLGKAVERDVLAANDFKNKRRLKFREGEPARKKYEALVARQAELKGKAPEAMTDSDRAELESVSRQLAAYGPEQILIQGAPGEEPTVYDVPNPYVALRYRENPAVHVDFWDPNGTTGKESLSEEDMSRLSANSKVLRALAPREMIADHAAAVALLEALWYCGSNPTVSDDPRCFPARILGELREFHEAKLQAAQAGLAKHMLADKSWPVLRTMSRALRNALAGAEIVMPSIPAAPTPIPAPAAAPAPAPVAPATAPATSVSATTKKPRETLRVRFRPPIGIGAGTASRAARAAAVPVPSGIGAVIPPPTETVVVSG